MPLFKRVEKGENHLKPKRKSLSRWSDHYWTTLALKKQRTLRTTTTLYHKPFNIAKIAFDKNT